ncbi:MAG: low molecular weight phosphotyrosine protein phosphatase [Alphaproteobacteria bacterium]|nr:low molecular weight phosphotyrosine protein phosphatase [Alphaproteobacteria bacterium]
MTSVLLVCLGNICRSPMAEGILRARLRARGLTEAYTVDSAGTAGWHVGRPADPRTLEVLARHDALCPLTARQVAAEDFERFRWILAMDQSNLTDLQLRCPPALRDRLHLALAPTGGGDVPDPYYGGADGFEHVYRLLDTALDAWLARWEGQPSGV